MNEAACLCFPVGRKINESSGKQSRSKSTKREVEGKRKKFTVCTSASSLFACSKLWVIMRDLWCWKWTELKLYNELFHLNQVQFHLLIRSDPHTISVFFWSLWLVECTTFNFSMETLPHCSEPIFRGNEPWSMNKRTDFLTISFTVFVLNSGQLSA